MNKIPRKSKDCAHCYKHNGDCVVYLGGCALHPSGADYDGTEVYQPSEWVQHVVGKRYAGAWGEGVYECTGYDPRCGFWMQNINDGADLRNVSERAIDRTYHRIRERV